MRWKRAVRWVLLGIAVEAIAVGAYLLGVTSAFERPRLEGPTGFLIADGFGFGPSFTKYGCPGPDKMLVFVPQGDAQRGLGPNARAIIDAGGSLSLGPAQALDAEPRCLVMDVP